MANQTDIRESCPLEKATNLIGGKWKAIILYRLLDRTYRFNELQRSINDITRRMLTLQLRELEADGLVVRKVYQQVPPKVEYSPTDLSRKLHPVLEQLRIWGEHYLQ